MVVNVIWGIPETVMIAPEGTIITAEGYPISSSPPCVKWLVAREAIR